MENETFMELLDAHGSRTISMSGPWDSSVFKKMKEYNACGFGWDVPVEDWITGTDLGVLDDAPSLKHFGFNGNPLSYEPLYRHADTLEELYLNTGPDAELDFTRFPKLKDLTLVDRPGIEAVYGMKHLEWLCIMKWKPKSKNLEDLKNLTNLQDLDIQGGNITSLEGVQALKKLKKLFVAVKTLKSIDEIEGHPQLEQVDFQACKKLNNINALGTLSSLRRIDLGTLGKIESFHPLLKLKKLEEIYTTGSTRIVDDDIACLKRLKTLRCVMLSNFESYNACDNEFPQNPRTSPAEAANAVKQI